MNGGSSSSKGFGRLRAVIWPIHGWEMKKFLPMSMMMFCMLAIYALIRDLKDTLVIRVATGGGSPCTSAAKLWGVLPMAVVAIAAYSILVKKIGVEKTFYVSVTFFLAFFTIFGFVLFPMRDILHPSAEWTNRAMHDLPRIAPTVSLIGNWTFFVFYIMAELWGSVAINALFWQFANKITKKDEVKRFYGLFACIGNFGLIFTGSLVIYLSNFTERATKSGNSNALTQNVIIQMSVVLFLGILLLCLYKYMNKKILTNPKFYSSKNVKIEKKRKEMSLGRSVKKIFTSSYLMFMLFITLGYGIAIHLTEVVYNDRIKVFSEQLGGDAAFNALKGYLSIVTGVITIFVTIVASNIIRACKWRTVAAITPISLLGLGGLFFCLLFYAQFHGGFDIQLFGLAFTPLVFWLGTFTDGLCKGIKYSLYDSSKQMAYIPLDPTLKTEGQAAVETFGGRMGKAGGAVTVTALAAIVGDAGVIKMAPVLSIALLLVVGAWIISVFALSKKYEFLKIKKLEEDKESHIIAE